MDIKQCARCLRSFRPIPVGKDAKKPPPRHYYCFEVECRKYHYVDGDLFWAHLPSEYEKPEGSDSDEEEEEGEEEEGEEEDSNSDEEEDGSDSEEEEKHKNEMEEKHKKEMDAVQKQLLALQNQLEALATNKSTTMDVKKIEEDITKLPDYAAVITKDEFDKRKEWAAKMEAIKPPPDGTLGAFLIAALQVKLKAGGMIKKAVKKGDTVFAQRVQALQKKFNVARVIDGSVEEIAKRVAKTKSSSGVAVPAH